MKQKIMLIGIVVIATLTIIAMTNIFFYTQTSNLCTLIHNGETERALKRISQMHNVNSYSAPQIFRWFFNITGKGIELPLVEACREGNYDVVIALLEKGADPNKYLQGNRSPIEAAFVSGNENRLKIAQKLIQYGADIDSCGSGNTALFLELRNLIYSSTINDDELVIIEESVIFLLDNGASPSDDKGNSVIHYLCFAGEIDLLNKVVDKYGYQLDCKNHKGQTPLMWAIEGNELETVKFLLNSNVNIDVIDTRGKKALDYAVESNNVDIIDLLNKRN